MQESTARPSAKINAILRRRFDGQLLAVGKNLEKARNVAGIRAAAAKVIRPYGSV
jgi:hypothetical protein